MFNDADRTTWQRAALATPLLLGLLIARNGSAQPAAESQPSEKTPKVAQSTEGVQAPLNVVLVTATRVDRAHYEPPTPTIVVGSDQLKELATTNVANYLNTLSVFKPDTTSSVNSPSAREAGANFLDLRGLGPSRTLVLVDGLRFVPQADAGIPDYHVDLNQIPELMVDRVEVVTGGASAQWGSDAVAGVVNIILKKRYTGLEAEAQAGSSVYGDNHDTRVGIIAGKNYLDGRLNVTFSADFENNNGIGDQNTRPWGRKQWWLIANPCPGTSPVSASCPAGGNGLAQQLMVPNAQFSTVAPGGVINNTALQGTTFGPGAVPEAFTYGNYVSGDFMQGGGQPGINYTKYQNIETPYRREVGYARITYDISDRISAYTELSYARSRTGGLGIPYTTDTTIHSDNAFLPAATKAQMQSLGISSFDLGSYTSSIIFQNNLVNETARGVFGLKGKFGRDNAWKWSADVGDGKNKYMLSVPDSIIRSNFKYAADAVINPATGQVTCRALVPGSSTYDPVAAAGCIPMDLFGPGSASGAAAYVTGTLHTNIDYRQTFADFSISGSPMSDWAGRVSVASGVDYRSEAMDAMADPIANAGGYIGTNSASFSGNFNVKEMFAETVIPVLKHSIIGDLMQIDAAVRYEKYSVVSSRQIPWKVGVDYRPIRSVLLRAAQSFDIRAPNIFERNDPASERNTTVSYGSFQPLVSSIAEGNPNLQPEKSHTTTYGIVFTPQFARGLKVSLDHWEIDIGNAVTTLGAQDVADFCLAGRQSFCNLMRFDSSGSPTTIYLPFLNLASVDTMGFDGQFSYWLPLSRISSSLPGAVTFEFGGTYTSHMYVNSGTFGAPTIDRAGENGPINQFAVPRFVSTTSIGYSNDAFNLMVQAQQVSAGNYDNTFTAAMINNNRIPGAIYWNLSGSYHVSPRLSIFGVVNNLFNKSPPADPTDNNGSTNPTYYDVIGTMIRLGVRYRME